MAKRKPITSVDDLFGKPKSPPAPTPTPATGTPRSGAGKRKPKSPAAGSDQKVTKAAGKTRPVKARTDRAIEKEYATYGKPISFRLPPKLDAEIERIAKAEGVGKTDLVRHVLERFISDHKRGAWPLKKQAKTYKIT
jgi:hypothetical protein